MIYLHFILQEELAAWVMFQKKKWEFQAKQRALRHKRRRLEDGEHTTTGGLVRSGAGVGIGGFLRRKGRTMLDMPWQVVQVSSKLHI